jgi:hypothetical protein
MMAEGMVSSGLGVFKLKDLEVEVTMKGIASNRAAVRVVVVQGDVGVIVCVD